MPQKPKKTPTSLLRHRPRATLSLVLSWLALSGCAQTPSAEPPLIARSPRLAPLPAAISQIDTRPSTDTLSKGRRWSESSEQLLSGETPK